MLYANTDDGSSALWVCDEDGIVVDNISYSIGDRAPILEQINEHYGTSFTGWSDNEIGLRIGDTIPNWNAYEKIELATPFIWKMFMPNSDVLAFGKVQNNILICYSYRIENIAIANVSGLIIGSTQEGENFFTSLVKPKLDELGISYTSIAYDTSTYSINDNVENWDEYTLLE